MALVLLTGLMSILLTSTCGLNLTTPSSEYQAALGHDISLRCHFTLASVDVGDLEIGWTVNHSDDQEEEEHLICYIEDFIYLGALGAGQPAEDAGASGAGRTAGSTVHWFGVAGGGPGCLGIRYGCEWAW